RCHAGGGINQGLASLAFHKRGMRNAADEIGRAADEVIGTAHVAPVGVVHVSKNVIASFQHTRESFALYGDHAVFRNGSNEIFFKRSEEHTSELQSRFDLVCRLLLEKKNI